MREEELAKKYLQELNNLKVVKSYGPYQISVPLKSSEFEHVDLDSLQNKLKSMGMYVTIQSQPNKNIFKADERRLIVSLTPFE